MMYTKETLDNAYYINGQPLVSDAEYDRLTSICKEIGTALKGSEKVFHVKPCLSLDKVYEINALRHFVESNEEVIAERKVDGITAVFYYTEGKLEKVLSRGNGIVGNNITENVLRFSNVPFKLLEKKTIVIRGELFINKANFSRYNDLGYNSSRDLTTTLIMNGSNEINERIVNLICYEIVESNSDYLEDVKELARLNLPIDTKRISVTDFSKIEESIKYLLTETEMTCDGVVFKINDRKAIDLLGSTQKAPRYQLAYKPPSKPKETIITGFKRGKRNLIAILDPIEIDGVNISKIMVNDYDEWQIGDRLAIQLKGGVATLAEDI